MTWRAADIQIDLRADETDDPVATATIVTPAGVLVAMAEVSRVGRSVTFAGFHMHGETCGPNTFGAGNLRRLAQAVMELMDADEIVIGGAVRTTGANPGRRPGAWRFLRAPEPSA